GVEKEQHADHVHAVEVVEVEVEMDRPRGGDEQGQGDSSGFHAGGYASRPGAVWPRLPRVLWRPTSPGERRPPPRGARPPLGTASTAWQTRAQRRRALRR